MTMSAAVMDKAVDVIDGLRAQLAARERLIVDLRQMLADVRGDLAVQGAELDQLRARVATRNVRNAKARVNA
ncbi:MAG: hypothetical protein IPJ58_16540 [Ardenticatenia bacterium]|nr:hypothetical protein [Ardenticatenia bacterium]